MMRFLRPRHFIVALGLLAGLLGTAAPAQAQIVATLTGDAQLEGTNLTFNVHLDNDGPAAVVADADEIHFDTSDGTATASGFSSTGGNDYEPRDLGAEG